MQTAQQDPEAAQQQMQQVKEQAQQIQQEIQNVAAKPNIDQVLELLRDQRSRGFILDIETDSTIMADENAEKQRRTEFMQMIGGVMTQLSQMIQADPDSIDLAGQILKFATAPFRAGRPLDAAIDDYVELRKDKSPGPRPDDPTTATNKTAIQIEKMKQDRQAEKDKADVQLKKQELDQKDQHERLKIQSSQQLKMMELQQKQADDAAKVQQTNQKAMHDREKHQADMLGKQFDVQADARKLQMMEAQQQAKAGDMQMRQQERQAAQAFKQQNQPPQRTPF
jgi:hypothetical protein